MGGKSAGVEWSRELLCTTQHMAREKGRRGRGVACGRDLRLDCANNARGVTEPSKERATWTRTSEQVMIPQVQVQRSREVERGRERSREVERERSRQNTETDTQTYRYTHTHLRCCPCGNTAGNHQLACTAPAALHSRTRYTAAARVPSPSSPTQTRGQCRRRIPHTRKCSTQRPRASSTPPLQQRLRRQRTGICEQRGGACLRRHTRQPRCLCIVCSRGSPSPEQVGAHARVCVAGKRGRTQAVGRRDGRVKKTPTHRSARGGGVAEKAWEAMGEVERGRETAHAYVHTHTHTFTLTCSLK